MMKVVVFGAHGATGEDPDEYLRKIMAIATYSMLPSVLRLMTQEAFKKPVKS